MLEATVRLARLLASPQRRWWMEDALLSVVERHGAPEDSRMLLGEFLRSPSRCERIIPALIAHGDHETAAVLADRFVVDGRLIEETPVGVLEVLGALGLNEATPTLFHYLCHGDHSEGRSAALGLLHLPCTEIRAEIAREIDGCEGRHLFPEFIPALACKTGDASWIDRLVAMGDAASTDCNGGLLLGIALFGEQARDRFTKVLWDQHWEANDTGTGSCRWAYVGTKLLGLTPEVLYADLCGRLSDHDDVRSTRYCVSVLVKMVERWAEGASTGLRWLPAAPMSATALLHLLFDWSDPNRDDGLAGRVKEALGKEYWDSGLHNHIHGLEQELNLRMQHEVELSWALARTC